MILEVIQRPQRVLDGRRESWVLKNRGRRTEQNLRYRVGGGGGRKGLKGVFPNGTEQRPSDLQPTIQRIKKAGFALKYELR